MTEQAEVVDFIEGVGVAVIERTHITVELTLRVRCPLGEGATDGDVRNHNETTADCVDFIGGKLRAGAEAVADDVEQIAAGLDGTSDDKQIVRHRDNRGLMLNNQGMETSLYVVIKSVRELGRSFLMEAGERILSYFFELTLQDVLDYESDNEAYVGELPVVLMLPMDLAFLEFNRSGAALKWSVENDDPQLGDRA